ncbi:hypothetical protein GCM10009001_21470 [Virgibacillus siamensis]|uniref:DUF4386 family protein n=1 Tax=Virgibacillus siamensis TaxID=480071 RepID=A0ABP3R5Q7_9BACI
MNRYLKLVNFEMGRFIKIYLILIAITAVVQIIGVIVKAKTYMAKADQKIYEEMMSKSDFLDEFGTMSMMDVAQSLWLMAPIALCVVTLIIYIFLIWYRDWFGKNTFIYRLLMLPTNRLNVYLAKATAIFLMVLGLVSIQMLFLPLENLLLMRLVPDDFQTNVGVFEIVHNHRELAILYPQSFIEFVLHYGAGFMAVFILFTAIMFERSFRWKGILLAVLYGGLSIIVFVLPFIFMMVTEHPLLYPLELLGLEVLFGIMITAAAIWVGHYLLMKKIRV